MRNVDTLNWYEKYRPKSFNDLIVPKKYKQKFADITQDYIFFGDSGIGKTTTAKIILSNHKDVKIYSGGSLTKEIIDTKMRSFISTISNSSKVKIIFIDEFDAIDNARTINALKVLIEGSSRNGCKFIACTNNIDKVDQHLLSRFNPIDFSFPEIETKRLVNAFKKRIVSIVEKEKVSIDSKSLELIIDKGYPDYRAVLNKIQDLSNSGKSKIIFDEVDVSSLSKVKDVDVILNNIYTLDNFELMNFAQTNLVNQEKKTIANITRNFYKYIKDNYKVCDFEIFKNILEKGVFYENSCATSDNMNCLLAFLCSIKDILNNE